MKKKLFATSVVALFLLTFIPATFAFRGFGGGSNQNEAVQTALEDADYAAFQTALAEENIDRFKNISEEDFAKMVERHAEIGIKKAEMEEYRDAIAAAIEDGGFEKWQTLVSEKNENSPLLEKITADNFDQFAEMHDLQNQAREIGDELGIGGPGVGMIGGEMGGKMGAKHGGDSDGKRGGGRHFQN